MKKPLILFGTGKIAEVVRYYLDQGADYRVDAVTVDGEYVDAEEWNGLPLVPFEEIEERYPANDFEMFVATGYQGMNSLRAGKVAEAQAKGYRLASCIGTDAPADLEHGDNCFVMPGALVHPRVRLGDNVFVWSGAMVGHHSVVGDHCWITSGANVSGNVTVGHSCFFAVNSTVGHGVTLGSRCFLGANALVTKCTDDGEVFIEGATEKFRLDVDQFLRISNFQDL